MKVLFIACLYPPIANSGTQRSLKFANYLQDYGWEPIVLTVDNPEDILEPTLLSEVRSSVRVERVEFLSEVFAKKIGRALRALLPEQRVAEALGWRIRSLWKIPDQWASWRPTAVSRALDIFHIDGFDCIYATGYPWTSFQVARDISIKTGKPYVLDYRDLWNSWKVEWIRSSWFADWLSRRQERSVIYNASAIITTTDTMTRVLIKLLPASSECPVVCITNGYDPEDFLVESIHKNDLSKVRIVYTGIWKAGYSPKLLYDAIHHIQSNFPAIYDCLDVICAGFPPGISGYNCFDGTVQELGRLTHCEAISLMKGADALFLPVSEGEYALGSLPGKLFEYLASGKPIIAAVPAESEVAQILNRVGGATMVEPGDVNGLAKILANVAQAGRPTWGTPNPSLTACFERRNLTSQLAEVLSSVTRMQ